MIFAVDVYYHADQAMVAGVLFENWDDAEPTYELTTKVVGIAEYEPGQFYKRELPCILEILGQLDRLPDYIIVDGYVYLDRDRKPGLGHYLYNAIDRKATVIGVAKTRFQDVPTNTEIFRGESDRPLYVTAVGIDESQAKNSIERMHGKHRIPTLLKIVDKLTKET